mmetsp:Transcript_38492/g.121788  ORF Transcript_38492/g.121788 Transcript_38492/m.121788 type:complete len:277 (-) Transcript_38492:1245-2075(-)
MEGQPGRVHRGARSSGGGEAPAGGCAQAHAEAQEVPQDLERGHLRHQPDAQGLHRAAAGPLHPRRSYVRPHVRMDECARGGHLVRLGEGRQLLHRGRGVPRMPRDPLRRGPLRLPGGEHPPRVLPLHRHGGVCGGGEWRDRDGALGVRRFPPRLFRGLDHLELADIHDHLAGDPHPHPLVPLLSLVEHPRPVDLPPGVDLHPALRGARVALAPPARHRRDQPPLLGHLPRGCRRRAPGGARGRGCRGQGPRPPGISEGPSGPNVGRKLRPSGPGGR